MYIQYLVMMPKEGIDPYTRCNVQIKRKLKEKNQMVI